MLNPEQLTKEIVLIAKEADQIIPRFYGACSGIRLAPYHRLRQPNDPSKSTAADYGIYGYDFIMFSFAIVFDFRYL